MICKLLAKQYILGSLLFVAIRNFKWNEKIHKLSLYIINSRDLINTTWKASSDMDLLQLSITWKIKGNPTTFLHCIVLCLVVFRDQNHSCLWKALLGSIYLLLSTRCCSVLRMPLHCAFYILSLHCPLCSSLACFPSK